MDKSVSQFKEIYKVSGEEYLLLTYPNISNAKIKLKHIIGSIDFVINGVTKQQMWQLMKAPTDEQINISHLNDALQNYPTIDWVKRQQYLTIEDVDDFVTSELEDKVDKSEIADMATETWVTQQGFLTEHQDISNLATKTEVVEGLASKQNKGDYALKSDLNDLATKEELSTKQDVLTSGVNIVTINGQSLLNGGNIEIEDNGITDAPTDDKIYGRKNGNWSIIEDNVGKVYQSDIYPNAEIFNDYENNIAFGQYAHAEGRETNATGSRAHAEGYKTSVFAADAHAEGRETWVIGNQAHAEGIYTIAWGGSSHCEGSVQTSFETGDKVLEERLIRNFLNQFTSWEYPNGSDSAYYAKINFDTLNAYKYHIALGLSTHCEGINNIVCDKAGHVEGYNNICGDMIPGMNQDSISYAPHAEGVNNRIESCLIAAHVGGGYNHIKSGSYTFAHGYNLSVENTNEVAFGRYNASEVDGKKVLFSYGIGFSDTSRKNAISVFEDGSVAIPNLVGFDTDINQKLESLVESLESKLTEIINTFNNQIINIYNKLSNGDITSSVFVINDTLIITNRINTEITDTDLAISDEMFIFADGDLSYNSNDGYLTNAKYENGNLIFESTNE